MHAAASVPENKGAVSFPDDLIGENQSRASGTGFWQVETGLLLMGSYLLFPLVLEIKIRTLYMRSKHVCLPSSYIHLQSFIFHILF